MSIKIWAKPSVAILAMSTYTLPGKDFAEWRSNDPGFNSSLDIIPEIAGRVCYMSFGRGRPTNSEYIDNILAKEHESVLEHSVVTFGIQGISRTCSHELVRHRHLSYSQLSQRYVKDTPEFVIPVNWEEGHTDEFYRFVEGARKQWNEIVELEGKDGDKKWREVARALLPGCTETKLVVTGNIRAWRHFLKLRGSPAAEPEIRRLALAIYHQIYFVAPHCLADLEVKDGFVIKAPRTA